MKADGTGRRLLTQVGTASPAWSPDGSRIAFTGYRSFPQFGSRFGVPIRQDVFVVDADGRNLRRLTGPFADDELVGSDGSQPTWWPDGSRLFYVSQRSPAAPTTFVMNADGTCQSGFGPVAPDLRRPVWQPGGGPLPSITRCAEMRVGLTGEKSPVALKEQAPFTVTVQNAGNVPATNALLRLATNTAALTIYTTGSGECSSRVGSPDIVCSFRSIPPRGSERIDISAARTKPGSVLVHAAVSADELDTDPTNNTVEASAQVLPCTLVGTPGSDRLVGTPGPDRICGLPGADTIYGGKGNDYIDAGNGDDRIYPGPGRDTVIAKGGNDVIEARDGERDWIDCGSQHDVAIVDRIDVVRHCEVVERPPR